VAAARPGIEATAITSTHAFNTGWRGMPYKGQNRIKQPEPAMASETSADDEPIDEHEPDDEDDLFNLVDHTDNEDKEY
jgi:hypothetical protein